MSNQHQLKRLSQCEDRLGAIEAHLLRVDYDPDAKFEPFGAPQPTPADERPNGPAEVVGERDPNVGRVVKHTDGQWFRVGELLKAGDNPEWGWTLDGVYNRQIYPPWPQRDLNIGNYHATPLRTVEHEGVVYEIGRLAKVGDPAGFYWDDYIKLEIKLPAWYDDAQHTHILTQIHPEPQEEKVNVVMGIDHGSDAGDATAYIIQGKITKGNADLKSDLAAMTAERDELRNDVAVISKLRDELSKLRDDYRKRCFAAEAKLANIKKEVE